MKDSQEQQDTFIAEFTAVSTEGRLRQYEAKHRERISESSLLIRDAFDQHWKSVTGKSYYQPVTTQPVVMPTGGQNNTQRTDPKSRKYCAKVVFQSVSWQKLPRRKIGKRYKDLYNLKGIDDTGNERPIYNNLDSDKLASLLGMPARDSIIDKAKSIDHGEIEGQFPIDVEGYWEVVFSPQQSPNDPKDVRLMWEGQCLIIQRQKEIVLPGFYIEVADNALRDHYSHESGQGRKRIGTIQEYPYTTLREATRAEYIEQKTRGDRIQREKLMREEG
jgi:hypothetical protein